MKVLKLILTDIGSNAVDMIILVFVLSWIFSLGGLIIFIGIITDYGSLKWAFILTSPYLIADIWVIQMYVDDKIQSLEKNK